MIRPAVRKDGVARTEVEVWTRHSRHSLNCIASQSLAVVEEALNRYVQFEECRPQVQASNSSIVETPVWEIPGSRGWETPKGGKRNVRTLPQSVAERLGNAPGGLYHVVASRRKAHHWRQRAQRAVPIRSDRADKYSCSPRIRS